MSLAIKVAEEISKRVCTNEGAEDIVRKEAEDFIKSIGLPIEEWKIFFADGRWWLYTYVGDQFEEEIYWIVVDTRNGLEFEREHYAEASH